MMTMMMQLIACDVKVDDDEAAAVATGDAKDVSESALSSVSFVGSL